MSYIRWGRTTCPTGQKAELVYAGRAGGTHWNYKGGAANFLCLPNEPDHLMSSAGAQNYAGLAGVEYKYDSFPYLSSFNNHNVPCAVCYVASRSTVLMVPAKTKCPKDWTLEYIGYIMTEHRVHSSPKMFECVDRDPESIPGLESAAALRAVLYTVEPTCGGLACPPYDATKELTCAVCTR